MTVNTISLQSLCGRLADRRIACVFFHNQLSKTLSATVLSMCIWGAWLKKDVILLTSLYCFDLIHLVVRAFHFDMQIVMFCKPIDKTLCQGQIFSFLGQMCKIDNGHSCGFAYRYLYLSYHSSVTLVAVLSIFSIQPVNIYSIKKFC